MIRGISSIRTGVSKTKKLAPEIAKNELQRILAAAFKLAHYPPPHFRKEDGL
jgi:hypothetical protein